MIWRAISARPYDKVLERIDPADRAVLAQVGRPWLAAVVASGLPRAGKRGAVVGPARYCLPHIGIERQTWSDALADCCLKGA